MMTRPGVIWILSSAVGLALLPGCLGRMAGARVGPEQQQAGGTAGVRQPSANGAALVVENDGGSSAASPPSPSPVAPPPPPDAPSSSVPILQAVMERHEPPRIEVAAQPAPQLPGPSELETHIKAAKLATASSDPPIVEALRCALNSEPEKALEHLKGFGPATQDFLIRLLPAVAQLGQKPLEQLNPEDVTVLQEQFEGFLETLRPYTRLAINRMCCCKWIKGYGNYEPMPEGHLFHAASSTGFRDGEKVKVYVELRNFRCELRDRYHEIRLSSSVEIRDPREPPDAKPLWYYRFEDQSEPVRSRVQLHDFFTYYWFLVPHIPPGTYTLTIQVADETVPERRRVACKSQEFRVTAMPVSGGW